MLQRSELLLARRLQSFSEFEHLALVGLALASCTWLNAPPAPSEFVDGGAGEGADGGREEPRPLEKVTAIAAGAFHSCALVEGGDLYCWGQNHYGQLGTGDRLRRDYATKIELSDVRSVACGEAHTCAIRGDDSLWCWGHGGFGETGLGHSLDTLAPEQVTGLAGVRLVFASLRTWAEGTPRGHTCAIDQNDDLFCWGANWEGQLGVGDTEERTSPAKVDLESVQSLALGAKHSCALRQNGEVHCWGGGSEYQLGLGDTTSHTTPQAVPGLGEIQRLTAATRATCAITTSEQVWCWGLNLKGSLGIQRSPTEPELTDLEPSVVLGNLGGCDLRGGQPWCWGRSSHGRFGSSDFQLAAPEPQEADDVEEVALGWDHLCYRGSDGSATCAGPRRWLGAGPETSPLSPTLLGASASASQISLGWRGGCLRSALGEGVCWGVNDSGRLGSGSQTAWSEGSTIDQSSTGMLSQIAVAGSSACALSMAGDAYCWGSDDLQQLGNGAEAEDKLRPAAVGALPAQSVVAIELGYHVGCAITETTERDLYCWGHDDDYRHGLDLGRLPTPTKVEALTEPQDLSLSAGGSAGFGGDVHGCALRNPEDGGLICWGANRRGQLGTGSNGGRQLPTAIETPCTGLPRSASTGGETTCLACENGDLYCFGDNRKGQLGLGHFQDRSSAGEATLDGVEQVAVARYHACALRDSTEQSQVYCWGANESGQLGSEEGSSNTPVEVDLSFAVGATPIAVSVSGPEPVVGDHFQGEGTTCVLFEDGQVYCFGNSYNGQLGDVEARHGVATVQVAPGGE